MSIEIYYFSGTGNSYNIARSIASDLDAHLIPVISLKNKESINSNAEVIGLVFPIYDFKAPEMIYEFIKKLQPDRSPYIFAVCSYGIKPLNTMKKLNDHLQTNSYTLAGGFCIHMPHNGIGYNEIPVEKQKKMFTNAENKCKTIIDYVQKRKQGIIEKSIVIDRIVLIGIFIRILPKLIPMLTRALLKGWDSLGFYVDEHCDSCKICSKICPVDNIELIEGKPTWDDNCINCFACFHWCPQNSIQIAHLTQKMKRYHHPDVKLIDIIKQKQQ